MPETPCPGCGYPLAGTSLARCPECGITTDPAYLAQATADISQRCMCWSAWMLLATAAAECIGRSIAFLPAPAAGSSGSGPQAALTLALLPKVALGVLGCLGLSLRGRPGAAPVAIRALFIVWVVTSLASNNAFMGTWFTFPNRESFRWWRDLIGDAADVLTPVSLLLTQHVWAKSAARIELRRVLAAPARWVQSIGVAAIIIAVASVLIDFVPAAQSNYPFSSPGGVPPALPASSFFSVHQQEIMSWLAWLRPMLNMLQAASLGIILLLAATARRTIP